MHSFPVYVPDRRASRRAQLSTSTIDPKSAIVGQNDAQDERLLICYESNRYNAANVRTFADRAMIAAGRLTERYPTFATALIPREALRKVGVFTAGHGVDVPDAASLLALASWLDLVADGTIASDTLARELRLSRKQPTSRHVH